MTLLAMMDLGMQLLKLLGIVGGFSVGWIGGGWLLKLLARFLLRKKEAPKSMLVATQGLGGILLAWLVFLWVFGTGGGGPGHGGLFGLGSGSGTGTGGPGTEKVVSKTKESEAAKKSEQREPAPVERKPGLGTLRIDLLGGQRVRDEKFYLLEGRPGPCNFAELRQAVLDRRQQKDLPLLQGIEMFIYENSVAQDHPAVRDLERWARENDLLVTLSFPKRELP